jgi:hypothetical protein
MRKKGTKNTKYSPEFKLSVIMDMRENHLSYHETMRKYFPCFDPRHYEFIQRWERIYLEEGAAGLYVERRGMATKMDNPKKGRPRKKPLNKEVENDLIAENQRLKEQLEYAQMENEYLKKLDALVRAREQQNEKKHK